MIINNFSNGLIFVVYISSKSIPSDSFNIVLQTRCFSITPAKPASTVWLRHAYASAVLEPKSIASNAMAIIEYPGFRRTVDAVIHFLLSGDNVVLFIQSNKTFSQQLSTSK